LAHDRVTITLDGKSLPVHSVNTLVIGSGAAGLNAALQVFDQGCKDVLILTEQWEAGTSRNAGSDKQTYYKLALAGRAPDSPLDMAGDLFSGKCMHGDIALIEAHHSPQAFFNLVRHRVPFPHDRYGGYVGFRTDHDTRSRGTSAGPLTSRYMCECLGRAVRDKGIPVLDGHVAVALLCDRDDRGRRCVCGVVAVDRSRQTDASFGFVLLNAVNVVLATGGPGGMYESSVYPVSQTGSTGLALAVGAVAQNLTESQFGLASIHVRWNVSGSYQQVIPRYVSTDPDGGDEQEFLADQFPDLRSLAGAIFRKGYQWPFDVEKVANHGSSLIDVLVFRETVERGRRVYLDYTRNPGHAPTGEAFSLDGLDDEAATYLRRSSAWLPTPIERLQAMNPQAVELYASHDIDLSRDRLEIAVCAQHSNGGLRADLWWESNLKHLFPVGEVNGSHGVRRPGGAALNAGQVGGIRAALYIAHEYSDPPPDIEAFLGRTGDQVTACLAFAGKVAGEEAAGKSLTPDRAVREIRERMTRCASHVRDPDRVQEAVEMAWALVERLWSDLRIRPEGGLVRAFRAVDLALTHAVYLEAIAEYLRKGGRSRGSALVRDPGGEAPCPGLGEAWRHVLTPPDDFVNRKILEVRLGEGFKVEKEWVDVRPVPGEAGWFETVWSDYLNGRVIGGEE